MVITGDEFRADLAETLDRWEHELRDVPAEAEFDSIRDQLQAFIAEGKRILRSR